MMHDEGLLIHNLINMEYSLEELVTRWKVCRGWEPLRTDATLRRQDAMDIDGYIASMLESEYGIMLESGPLEELVTEDVTGEVTVSRDADGVAVLTPGVGCRRVAEVMMEGWHRPATIVSEDDNTLSRQQLSPLSCGRDWHPVGVKERSGRVRLYSVASDRSLRPIRVLGVKEPPAGVVKVSAAGLRRLMSVGL